MFIVFKLGIFTALMLGQVVAGTALADQRGAAQAFCQGVAVSNYATLGMLWDDDSLRRNEIALTISSGVGESGESPQFKRGAYFFAQSMSEASVNAAREEVEALRQSGGHIKDAQVSNDIVRNSYEACLDWADQAIAQ